MQIGYARVSTSSQTLDGQIDALTKAGCDRVFEETASGARTDRPALRQALDMAREGDVIICYRLDRIARSLPHLIEIMDDLNKRGIGFKSLSENLDTTSSGGRLVFHIFGAVANFELDLIRERTKAGLEAARKRGRIGGRPKKLTDVQINSAKDMFAKGVPAAEIAAAFSVSVPTLYRTIPASSR